MQWRILIFFFFSDKQRIILQFCFTSRKFQVRVVIFLLRTNGKEKNNIWCLHYKRIYAYIIIPSSNQECKRMVQISQMCYFNSIIFQYDTNRPSKSPDIGVKYWSCFPIKFVWGWQTWSFQYSNSILKRIWSYNKHLAFTESNPINGFLLKIFYSSCK